MITKNENLKPIKKLNRVEAVERLKEAIFNLRTCFDELNISDKEIE